MKLTQPKKSQLNPEIWEIPPNPHLLAQAVHVHRTRARKGTKKTKSRSEVRGGGRKPWRQKGTGRARHGSIRSPIWRGGGHAHSLVPIDHKARLPKKMKRKALFSALSGKQDEGRIFVADLPEIEKPSTKRARDWVDGWELEGLTLVITPEPDENLKLSVRNLPNVEYLEARQLSVYPVLKAENLVFVDNSMDVLERTFLNRNG